MGQRHEEEGGKRDGRRTEEAERNIEREFNNIVILVLLM